MNVHSAICSYSVELYQLWYTLADFFPNCNFRGVFSKYHFYPCISAAAITGDLIFFSLVGPVGYYTGAHTAIFHWIFSIYYSADGTSEAAMGGAWLGDGGGGILF